MLPDLSELGALSRRYAAVSAALELEFGEQPLVLPDGEWFPDKFQGDLESVERLLCRMQGYAGLEATEITLALAGADQGGASCSPGKASSCGSCAAPTPGSDDIALERSASGYAIRLPASFIAHPIGLTSTLARLLGGIRFIESGQREADAEQGKPDRTRAEQLPQAAADDVADRPRRRQRQQRQAEEQADREGGERPEPAARLVAHAGAPAATVTRRSWYCASTG